MAATGDKHMTMMVFIALLLDLLAFTMILPLLPSLLEYYGTDKKDVLYRTILDSVSGFRELVGAPDTPRWNSVLFGGLIGSLYSFLQFCSSPLIGAASDVYGRKPVLLMTMVGVASSYAVWAVSKNFTLFVISRIIGGVSKGNVSLSTTIVTDTTTEKTRGKGMAMIGVAFSIGFVVGPICGAGFAKWARGHEGEFFQVPALFALTLALIDILFVTICFRETLPKTRRAFSVGNSFKDAANLISPIALFSFSAVQKLPRKELSVLRRLGFGYFLYLFIYSGLEFTLTFLVHNRFQYDSMQQGKMFCFLGFFMALVQGGVVRRVQPGSEKKHAVRGIMVLIPAFIIIGCTTGLAAFYFGLILFAYASGCVVPLLTTMVSSYGQDDQKGTIMGIFRSLGALARALGPVVSSIVYWSIGATGCYTIGGALLIIPLFHVMSTRTERFAH